VVSAGRPGFGTRLIDRTFTQSGGHATLEFHPQGLRCAVALPLSTPEELPQLEVTTDPSQPSG
jgi:two-component sensor histidine kinase